VTGPDFEAIVGGDDLAPDERERLLGAHEALLIAGPPAELTAVLARVPRPGGEVRPFPSGRRRSFFTLVAAAVIVAFSLGVAVANRSPDAFAASWTKPMHGTGVAPHASASLSGAKPDRAGNWRMLVKVNGLPKLHGKQYYVLWLTRDGKAIAECGTFKVGPGATVATFTEPYKIKDFDGWVVTIWRGPRSGVGPVVLRTETV
jgi:hypothetical protein